MSLSSYDYSTLNTALPYNLIKEKLLDLIEWTFKRALKTMVHFFWSVMTEKLFFTCSDQSRYTLWSCQNVCDALSYLLNNVMRQSACLVFNPIMVNKYAALFNCPLVGRASDSLMAPT